MKKFLSIILSCVMMSALSIPAFISGSAFAEDIQDSTSVHKTATDEEIDRAKNLLQQLVNEQKEKNNAAFRDTKIYVETANKSLNEIYDNKYILVEGGGPYAEEVTYYVKKVIKENNIDEDLVSFIWMEYALEHPNDYKFVPPTTEPATTATESATTIAEAETEDAEVKITAKAGNASIVLSQADVNTDGTVDAKDATVVLSDYAQSIASNATVLTPEIADANDDGVIDSKDATLILVYYADEISSK